MRNTSAISNVAHDPVFGDLFDLITKIKESRFGQSSTVTGQLPTAIIYDNDNSETINYTVLGRCVKLFLEKNPHILKTRLAILCSYEVSPRQLKTKTEEIMKDLQIN